jgi:transcriptional regulator with XRE-family HTH domain
MARQRQEFRNRVGGRIRDRRTALGLSQGQLARKLPGTVEGSQISRWERGESFPTYANVIALARAMDVSEELLLCGCESDEAHRPQQSRAAVA